MGTDGAAVGHLVSELVRDLAGADTAGALQTLVTGCRQLLDVDEIGISVRADEAGTVLAAGDLPDTTQSPTVATVPFLADDRVLGSLRLARRAGEIAAPDLAVAQGLADVVALALVGARRLRTSETRTAQLQRALDSRIVIEQAKGVLAERRGTDPEAAFRVLRSEARSRRVPLRTVCREVLGSTDPVG